MQTSAGPNPNLILHGKFFDMALTRHRFRRWSRRGIFRPRAGFGAFDLAATPLLSPVDLQCVKACGVTFAASAIERVIEERRAATLVIRQLSAISWKAALSSRSAP